MGIMKAVTYLIRSIYVIPQKPLAYRNRMRRAFFYVSFSY
ncbi:protein of unknown function [Acidithiobacillus ferrivorans]|uniref:Uncharacterized protein n=1 Tax=Acidithiobacillus ferrivorans TaxID=160808 RepID=A0ABY1MM63_9PROT|nr:protein of unknown function [Acidithiobacillus ferrivorans]